LAKQVVTPFARRVASSAWAPFMKASRSLLGGWWT
jgi:hypothetical protein